MDTTHDAALPLDQPTEDDELLKRVTLARRQDRAERLASKIARYQELSAEIERERRRIEHLDAVLADLNDAPIDVPGIAPAVSQNGSMRTPPKSKNFEAGNRSEKAPPRRPGFEGMSLTEAVRQLLSSGRAMTLDDLADAIYDIGNVEQKRIGKGSLRSAMAIGVERNQWKRVKEGVFHMDPQEVGETT